ncbi:hypothetical protein SAMN02745824_3315 [Parasphingorhabdus marina DSM 22363]|uniref:Uncharacterized protein n=1 Tax=Parasphingorhabdus marina DSM 22363 TaxID=1123272 RepID=A0A1N6HJJ8_9SPHN|nr:hypothetical protein [Parasphingorhabdus marina]SIO19825.1 hypothetical protein SAMN02745824_3315 [Parasphingorhabdus marina DSM 22363]
MIEKFRTGGAASLPALIAIWSMALMPAAPASGMMTIELCNADGVVRSVNIPLEKEGGGDENCATPCHACLSRQKHTGKPDRS